MTKIFTLSEAQELLPVLEKLIEEANTDLSSYHGRLHLANENYKKAEELLEELPKPTTDELILQLRNHRQQFQESIEALDLVQQEYIGRLNYWIDSITSHGVILRDLKAGLLDFPAQKGNLDYYLCWHAGESEISFWHLQNDGFIGRKSLSTLLEYY